ncbi:MAG: carbohydrate ABC transporter permease, partial [Paenibacillus macerans]|nr:carbohydrate ABC transporter permease [Paenibacillus macerans]
MKSIRLNRVIITALMGIAGIFFILPFLWMLSASFKPELEVMTYPIQWIPSTWKIVENYSQVWLGSIPFALYYLNSIEVTLLTTALSLIISAMAAYGFSKVNFKGRDVVFMLVLATYMIPHQA